MLYLVKDYYSIPSAKGQRVGFRVGATLRQQKKVYGSSNTNTNSASHRRLPIAHIRRGHFQGFWTGLRDSKKTEAGCKMGCSNLCTRTTRSRYNYRIYCKVNNLTGKETEAVHLCFFYSEEIMITKNKKGNSLISVKEAKRLANIKSKKMHELTLAMVYNVLLDKFGFDQKQLQDLYLAVAKLSLEIQEHRIKPQDLLDMLAAEYSIDLEKEYHDGMLWRK